MSTDAMVDGEERPSLWHRLRLRRPFFILPAQRATADNITAAPAPLRPIDLSDDAEVSQVLDLAVRVGEVVLAAGTGVTDTEAQVRFIASTYGLDKCDIDVTFDAIRITADRGTLLPPASDMRIVKYRSLDFTRLAAVDRLTRLIRAFVVPVDQAHAALDEIVSTRHPYPRWVSTAGWSLLAAAIAVLLGGGAVLAIISFATTALIDVVNRALHQLGLPIFFQHMVGGVIAAAPAIALSAFDEHWQADAALIVAAGITVLLSGQQLVGSVQDAITGAPITAAARMLEVVMMTGGIVAGIGLALRVSTMVGIKVPEIAASAGRDTEYLAIKVAAGAVAAIAFAMACYAERRALFAAGLSGAAGTVAFLVAQDIGFGPVVSSGMAATLVGLAGGLMARRALTPPLVVAVAGITPLLPGLKVYRGLYALLEDETLLGFGQILGAFGVGCALAAGVVLGEWFDRLIARRGTPRDFDPTYTSDR
ncbi:threonine/serine ThrE exporter family protein [Nocardia asteroides]|uniref:threonine/serine ThrE exporter family protein n=1 Tax=Nocardia asteroides TaxID=1824 RepID=UPI001E4D49C1|nr:threonine/serine exporter family protein [Nocardia asteroides]UGT52836.1 threonine/serine exporter family protein [Nocardia asteroides]